jgi:hypothetical protein
VKAFHPLILWIIALGLAPIAAHAQGITYLSNLAEPDLPPIYSVYSNNFWAQTFTTGPSTGGYVLNSVQLKAGTVGNPNGNFLVYLYPGLVPSPPSLGILTGSNPSILTNYTYTTPGISLSPSTTYAIVVTATAPYDANNYYFWEAPGLLVGRFLYIDLNFASIDDWMITGASPPSSSDGTNWIVDLVVESPLQFAVNATPVAAILSGCVTNNEFNLNFQTISNRNYTVQYKMSLTDADWISFTNFYADGFIKSIAVPLTNNAQFFRVSTP